MDTRDPEAVMDEIQRHSCAIARLIRRRKGGMLWCRFDEAELKRLEGERRRLQGLLPPMRIVASR